MCLLIILFVMFQLFILIFAPSFLLLSITLSLLVVLIGRKIFS